MSETSLSARVGARGICIALLFSTGLALAVAAQEQQPHASTLGMVRFEFDNDIALGSDDAYSAGWSLQLHTRLQDTWDTKARKLIGRLPGLGDDGDGGRVVRASLGLSQQIITPEDLTIEELQPEDAPYAGVLGIYGSWSSYDNDRLSALQLYVGCMGPCSFAEEVQEFVHNDLGNGTEPKGWDNQLDTKWLGNINYAYRHKVFSADEEAYAPGRWASDLSVGGQAGLGNFVRFVDGQIEYRFGWGLPMGFTHIPDPAGRAIVLDPVYVNPKGKAVVRDTWRGYASIVLRAAWIDDLVVAEGGRTVKGGYHPGFDPNDSQPEVLLGLHVGKQAFALHLTYHRYIGHRDESGPGSTNDWINLSLERRF